MLTKTDIENYFNAEKSESLLFIILGIAAIGVALIFFCYLKTNWHKGAAIPLLIIGFIHLVAGAIVFNRSDKDRIRITYAYDMNPGELASRELPRMELVNKKFVTYRYIEIALLLAGLALFLYFKSNAGRSFWVGLGFALAIEATISLTADYFAEKRAAAYSKQLESFVRK